ncbi:MAG: electron transfer flavoprotein subunit beta/FixA family protein [bacterium JZ-2024 1]
MLHVLVVMKMVPDVVEELEIAGDGKSLDTQWLRMIVSESDEHSLEEALILKEKYGATVTVVGFEAPELDEVLYTSLAKGADRVVKISGDFTGWRSPALARFIHSFLDSSGLLTPELLVFTGSQAIDDLEGEMAPYLAELTGLPFINLVSRVEVVDGKIRVQKEFPGGVRGEYELPLPAIVGVQSAEKPPRYVPVAKVRAIMKTAQIESVEVPGGEISPRVEVAQMYKPEVSGRAEMLEGTPEEVASRIVGILAERGLI